MKNLEWSTQLFDYNNDPESILYWSNVVRSQTRLFRTLKSLGLAIPKTQVDLNIQSKTILSTICLPYEHTSNDELTIIIFSPDQNLKESYRIHVSVELNMASFCEPSDSNVDFDVDKWHSEVKHIEDRLLHTEINYLNGLVSCETNTLSSHNSTKFGESLFAHLGT